MSNNSKTEVVIYETQLNQIKTNYYNVLNKLQQEKQLSQYEIANMLNVAPGTIPQLKKLGLRAMKNHLSLFLAKFPETKDDIFANLPEPDTTPYEEDRSIDIPIEKYNQILDMSHSTNQILAQEVKKKYEATEYLKSIAEDSPDYQLAQKVLRILA